MANRYQKVKGVDAVKDRKSGAILFNNKSHYQQALKRRKYVEKINKTCEENTQLKKKLDKVELIVNQLLEERNGN